MDNFIQQLSQRAHITPEQSKSAVQYMTEYFKKNLPIPVADQVERLLSGSTEAEPVAAVVGAHKV